MPAVGVLANTIDFRGEAIFEFAPIDEAGQRIMAGLVVQRTVQAPLLAEVVEHHDGPNEIARARRCACPDRATPGCAGSDRAGRPRTAKPCTAKSGRQYPACGPTGGWDRCATWPPRISGRDLAERGRPPATAHTD